MPETVLIAVVVGSCLASIAKSVPSIVWSLRCPADSPHYRLPAVASRLDRLANVFSPHLQSRWQRQRSGDGNA